MRTGITVAGAALAVAALVVACGNSAPPLSCTPSSCTAGARSYDVCARGDGNVTYRTGGASCTCKPGYCQDCATQIASYCGPGGAGGGGGGNAGGGGGGGGGSGGGGGGGGGGSTMTIAYARRNNVTAPITVSAVVTALATSTSGFNAYVEDPAGGAYSGILVYCNHHATTNVCPASVTAPALHDLVQLSGAIGAYKGQLQIVPSALSTTMANAALPPVLAVTPADVAATASNAGVLGVLASVSGSTFTVSNVTPPVLVDSRVMPGSDMGTPCKPPQYSGFEVDDGTGARFLVRQTFFATDHLSSSPECQSQPPPAVPVRQSDTFSRVSGVVDIDPYAAAANVVVVQPTADGDYTKN